MTERPAPLAPQDGQSDREVGRQASARLKGFIFAGLAVAIFSGWFVVTRFGVTHELRIWDITALRFGIGALILSPALFYGNRPLPSGAWREGLLFAVLWGAPFVLLVALGLQLTSAGHAASITPTLMPVFAGLLGWLVLRERPGRVRLAGYGAIFAGLLGLVAAGTGSGAALDLGGIAALILAAATWAIYTLRFRRSGVTPLQSAALICVWSAVLFLPPYLWFGASRLDRASAGELAVQGFYQGVLMSAVAIVTFNRAVTLLGPSAATAIIALIPVSTSLLALIILGEVPTVAGGLAIVLIVLGVVLAARPAPSARRNG